jgi:hypothetical protein
MQRTLQTRIRDIKAGKTRLRDAFPHVSKELQGELGEGEVLDPMLSVSLFSMLGLRG